jgi:hypothetical protein
VRGRKIGRVPEASVQNPFKGKLEVETYPECGSAERIQRRCLVSLVIAHVLAGELVLYSSLLNNVVILQCESKTISTFPRFDQQRIDRRVGELVERESTDQRDKPTNI